MTAINTNVSSILARNALVANERSMTTSMERLSTGVRINSAKDDAAGLAIASKMTAQIQGPVSYTHLTLPTNREV